MVERDAGMPVAFEWRGRRYEVRDFIARWQITAWQDGLKREYWRVEAKDGAVADICEHLATGTWTLVWLWP